MYPGDGGRGLSAVRFSAYNATASDMANSSIYTDILGNLSNAAFTDYPSQAGALFQWALSLIRDALIMPTLRRYRQGGCLKQTQTFGKV